jgi:hypothetical protein
LLGSGNELVSSAAKEGEKRIEFPFPGATCSQLLFGVGKVFLLIADDKSHRKEGKTIKRFATKDVDDDYEFLE